MRRYLPLLFVLAFAQVASAQPGIAINKDSSLQGTGSAGSALGVATSLTGRSLVSTRELSFSPVQEWAALGANLPTLELNNWAPDGIQTSTYIVTRGADNEGTRVTGIDTTGINVGDVRYFVNLPTGAAPPTDSGTITFVNESALSTAANRIQTPHGTDCTFPMYSVVGLVYGGLSGESPQLNRWRIIGDCGWATNATIQRLTFYPMCSVTSVSGTQNNYRPTCFTSMTAGYNLAGATTDSEDYTVIRLIVDPGGATLTGLYTTGAQVDPLAHGPVKVIQNIGSGTLTLKNLDAGSTVENRFTLPRGRDLILQPGESAILFSPFNNSIDLSSGWQVFATGQSNELFPTATVAGVTELQGALELSGITTPAALASGTTNNYNPGSRNPVWRLAANAAGSTLSGITAASLGDHEIHFIENVGSGELTFSHLDGGSSAGNRFSAPRGLNLTIASFGGCAIRYDHSIPAWTFIACTGDANSVRSSTNTTTTGCLPTWTNTTGTLSSTCSTSDNGTTLTVGASRLITIAGSTTFSQIFAAPGSIVDQPYWTSRLVPAALTSGSSNNDWNPASLHTKVWIVVQTTTGSTATLTGMNFGGSGELKVLCNFGSGPVKILNASASSSASNRFALAEGIDTTMPDNAIGRMPCIGFRYDNSNTQWEEVFRNFEGANPGLPTLSSCGTSPTTSTNCTNAHCTVTTGTGATACTITFGNGGYTNAPTCTVTAQDGTARAYSITTTAITLAAASASAKYDVICGGG